MLITASTYVQEECNSIGSRLLKYSNFMGSKEAKLLIFVAGYIKYYTTQCRVENPFAEVTSSFDFGLHWNISILDSLVTNEHCNIFLR
jgi:hypothetical protein